MTTMPTDNKDIVRRMNEAVWNEGDLKVIDEYFADDYVGHNPATPDETRGPEGFREYVQAARSAFPDLDVTTEDLVAEGDRVCRRTRTTGTHEGSYKGIEATGNAVDVSGMIIYRLEDGQIAESWGQNDMMGMMKQLGLA